MLVTSQFSKSHSGLYSTHPFILFAVPCTHVINYLQTVYVLCKTEIKN